jgi:glycosyltransferase involved in cell wall biosynthesis
MVPHEGRTGFGELQFSMMVNPTTIAVVPAFNEVETVGEAVRRVRAMGFPVVVVDDGSTDGTAVAAAHAGATVLTMPINIGVGGAMRTGFKYAVAQGYKRVIQVDADLQHPPEAIPVLIERSDDGVELVIGSRFASGYQTGGHRRVAMRALGAIVSRNVGVQLDDVTSGFRVISEPLLGHFAKVYPSEYLGDTVEAVLQASAFGASIDQVSVPMDQRSAGDATSTVAASAHLGRLAIALIARKPQGRTQ